jgi:hypothetical protein
MKKLDKIKLICPFRKQQQQNKHHQTGTSTSSSLLPQTKSAIQSLSLLPLYQPTARRLGSFVRRKHNRLLDSPHGIHIAYESSTSAWTVVGGMVVVVVGHRRRPNNTGSNSNSNSTTPTSNKVLETDNQEFSSGDASRSAGEGPK